MTMNFFILPMTPVGIKQALIETISHLHRSSKSDKLYVAILNVELILSSNGSSLQSLLLLPIYLYIETINLIVHRILSNLPDGIITIWLILYCMQLYKEHF